MREIKSGGGYLSFDSPEVHFGLGQGKEIEALTLMTPEGLRFDWERSFAAGRYVVKITR